MAGVDAGNKNGGRCFRSVTLLAILGISVFIVGCGAGSGEGLDINGRPVGEDSGDPSDPDPGTGEDDLFAPVQAIFSSRCTVCHAGASAPQGLILSEGQAYDAIVGVASSQQSDLLLVAPGAPEDSYLVHKIRGDSGITGAQMPRNGPPFLDGDEIQTIIDWITAGAPEPPEPDPSQPFVAEISDFADYQSWESVDYSIGPTNSALGSAHSAPDPSRSRKVFANSAALASEGDEFDSGSILVKEVASFESGEKQLEEAGGLLAMVKRGGDFNTDHNGWEWFELTEDASDFVARAPDLMEDGCNQCHQQANNDAEEGRLIGSGDYVFSHPSEYVAELEDFDNYRDWALIEERSDANPRLDGMAHGADREEQTTRKIYQRQLYAYPDSTTLGYPVGTTLVKEVFAGEELIEISAMVKRGGDFNTDHGSWEWFMLDPETGGFKEDESGDPVRGADVMENMCNGCHMAANVTSGEGIDYVFKHAGAPFNNNEEFVAELADFEGYAQWDLVDYTIGPVNDAIAPGHQGENQAFARMVYSNDTALTRDGSIYPRGSIYAKEVVTWESGEREFAPELGLVAMTKRGASFNPDHNNWEWFELEPDLSQIIGRGADYRNNGCNNCHQQSLADGEPGTDYVFRHPTEYVAESEDFANYQDWERIDQRSGDNPLLGGMAHQVETEDSTRNVYKKQLYARPLTEAGGYPVGTTIVKEVVTETETLELVAMVKRGADFNPDHGGWEWFMLNPDDAAIARDESGEPKRGGNLMDGMCNSCHTQATEEQGEGWDYVFHHAGDPFYESNQ